MFCRHCGKEIANDAKFCDGCGKALATTTGSREEYPKMQPTGSANQINYGYGMYNLNFNKKTIFLIATIIATIFVALGGIWPCITLNLFGQIREYSIKEIWGVITRLEEYGLDIGVVKVMLGGATMASIASAFFGGRFLLFFYHGQRRYTLVNQAILSMWCGVISFVLMLVTKWFVNSQTADEFYGVQLFETTSTGWMMLILALVNIHVFIKGYLGERILNIESMHFLNENERITREKLCIVCKTKYVLGSVCPKCGSKSTEQ